MNIKNKSTVKSAPVIALLLCALAAGTLPLQADVFTARRDEVIKQFNAIEKLVPRDQMDPVREGLVKYFAFREKMLLATLKLLEEKSSSRLKQAEEWDENLDKIAGDADKMLKDLLKICPSEEVGELVSDMITLEGGFYKSIKSMTLAETRDWLVLYREIFRKNKDYYGKKWSEFLNRDKAIDSSAKQARKDLKQLYEKTKRSAAEKALLDLRKVVLEFVKQPVKFAGAILPGEIASSADALVKHLEIYLPTVDNMVKKMSELEKRQKMLIVIFQKTHQDVSDFIRGSNYDVAEDKYEDSSKDAKGKAGNIPTANKADAARFADQGAKNLKVHLDGFKNEYTAFVNKFDKIFIGPLGDRTIEDIIEIQEWDRWSDEMQRISLDTALKRMYDDTKNLFGVNLSNFNSEQREWLEKKLEPEMDKLAALAKRALNQSLARAMANLLKDHTVTSFKLILEKLK